MKRARKKLSYYTVAVKEYIGKTRVEYLFLPLFIISGLLFVFLIPPFQNPDEPMHYYRSYASSRGEFVARPDKSGLYGGNIPLSMRQLVIDSGIEHNFDFGYTFKLDYRHLLSFGYGGPKVFEGYPNTAVYTPLAYVPSIAAHLVARALHLPLLVSLYFGRILSLLLVAAAFFFAIRLIPYGKWILFAVGLIPMTVASAAALSADAMTLSTAILLTALTVRFVFVKKVTTRMLVGYGALMLATALVKQAHIALLLLAALPILFNPRLRVKKVIVALSVALGVALIAYGIWFALTSGIRLNFSPSVNPIEQRSYVLHHPIAFVLTLINTYGTNYANGFVIGMFGNFGWLTVQLPTLFMILSAFTVFFAVMTRGDDEISPFRIIKKMSSRYSASLAIIFTAVLLLVSLALYLYWTPVRNPFIMGIQGRYFLPILPLLLLAFMTKRKAADHKMFVYAGSVICLVAATYAFLFRFYGQG